MIFKVLPVRWEEFYVVGPVGMFIIWLTISKLKIHSLNPLWVFFFLVSDCGLLIYPISGKVHVFRLHGNPDAMEPYTVIKVKVTDTLGPVLEKLGAQFSPVRSE